ncbi:MAG: hypothetical protein NVS4B2_05210 [Chloroflexota bacterium]
MIGARRRCFLVGTAAFALAVGVTVPGALADGLLPPQPYHYLHPPASLAGGNNPPTNGETGIPLQRGRQVNPVSFFTRDGQFGIDVDSATFNATPASYTIRLRIDPVETPAGLPSGLSADGNAYRIAATALPQNVPSPPTRTFGVVLRWPRLPRAIYVHDGHSWRLLCTAQQWEVSSSTVLCRTRIVGTYLAVVPGTLVPQSNPSPLQKFLPLILAVVVVILAAIAALFVTRRQRRPSPGAR